MTEPMSHARSYETVQWEYRTEPLKVSSFIDHLLTADLDKLGREGWELVKVLALAEPDPKGMFDQTIGTLVLRRPDNDHWEFRYVALKVDEQRNGFLGRFLFGERDKLGRQGWELVRIETLPRPDAHGYYETIYGTQVFRRPWS